MAKFKKLSANLQKLDYPAHRVDLYRQEAKDLMARSSGIERYVIGIFGPELIGSLALAMDPLQQFHNAPRRVSLLTDGNKIVRTRTIVTYPPSTRTENWVTRVVSRGYLHNPYGGVFDYYYTGPTTSTTQGTVNRSDQPTLYGFITDTTRRTRPLGFTGGEFEYFAPKLISRSRGHSFKRSDTLVYNSIGTGQRASTESWTTSTLHGPEFRCTNAEAQALLPSIRSRANAAMQKNVLGMLDRVQPSHRTYDYFYQIAELRDLPRTLVGSLQVWIAFERLVGTNVYRTLLRFSRNWRNPRLLRMYSRELGHTTGFAYDELRTVDQNAATAYLTFKFGWESMVRGVVQFLPSPHRTAVQINRLIASIGEDSSFRTSKHWIENEASLPTLTTNVLRHEDVVDFTVKKQGHRTCELRLMANFRIQFPKLDLPKLRRELALRKLGVYPSPSDVYNLIPWTWLADWFGGAGDYVQLMDSIANDRSLINYGFITYKEVSEVTASVRGQFVSTVSRTIDGPNVTYSRTEPYLHEGVFKYTYQVRRSIPSLTNVKSIWGSNLNSGQSAIMGALLSSRGGSARLRGAPLR